VNHIHDQTGPRVGERDAQPLDQLFALTVVMAEAMEHDLAQRGLTRARATVIWHLHAHGPMKQRDLAAKMRVSPRNVTALLEALAPSALVSRAPHPTDRRATLVSLTERGHRVARRLDADQQQLANFLFAEMPDAELSGFTKTMGRVLARLAGPEFDQLRRAALEQWPVTC
jgi:DNA-binding MarR family transcriptional regulator